MKAISLIKNNLMIEQFNEVQKLNIYTCLVFKQLENQELVKLGYITLI